MKTKLMAAVAVLSIMTAAGVARADDVTTLKQEAAALKKQNEALELRLNKLEKQQAAAPAPGAGDFMAQAGGAINTFATGDGPLTFHGITLFGTIDAGLGYYAHGLTQSQNMYAMPSVINKNANHAYFGMSPNTLAQSTIGIKGSEELLPGLSGVFMASTGWNPQSGMLANGPASLVNINGTVGRPTVNNGDGSRAGQAFNDQLYVGLSSKDFGQLTFGRHRSFALDTVVSYDPIGGGYGFSPIGYSGTYAAGFGVTEDARWDDSLKYRIEYGPVHAGVMYKFADGNGGSNVGNTYLGNPIYVNNFTANNSAYQLNFGGKYANFEADAVFGQFNNATVLSALTSAQLNGVSTFTSPTGVVTTTTLNNNAGTLAATAYNTVGSMLAAKYTWNQFKFFGGYAYNHFQNPNEALGIGGNGNQGGYVLSTVNNHPFANNDRILQTFWTGVKYAWDPKLDLTVAYYHTLQNQFTTVGANTTSCSNAYNTARNSACSGTLDAVSLLADYHFTKRFDVYAGMMVSSVGGGLSSGYLYSTNWAPAAGARFTF